MTRGSPHVCIVTSHDKFLTPSMASCSASKAEAIAWIAAGSGAKNSTPASRIEGLTVRLAACSSLSTAACSGGSFILANAPASFSRLDPRYFSKPSEDPSLRRRLARLDSACKRAGVGTDDFPQSGRWGVPRGQKPQQLAVSSGPYSSLPSRNIDSAVCSDGGGADLAAPSDAWASLDGWPAAVRGGPRLARGQSWCAVAILREAMITLPECDLVGWADPATALLPAAARASVLSNETFLEGVMPGGVVVAGEEDGAVDTGLVLLRSSDSSLEVLRKLWCENGQSQDQGLTTTWKRRHQGAGGAQGLRAAAAEAAALNSVHSSLVRLPATMKLSLPALRAGAVRHFWFPGTSQVSA